MRSLRCRDLFTTLYSKGCHQLIRNGAKLVETTQHIVEELGALLQLLANRTPVASIATTYPADLEPHLATLLEAVDYEPTGFDALIERSGIESADLSGYLLELELAGWLESCAGAWQRIR